ncbi:MAG: cAMP/cGMP-dependent 3',5'-cyclic-AMP/GMP phosphodiesterase [Leptospiraceae bacterium]|nr:cAMP/cGMP-dependent 3',5'-cyclic-AMP/GMP phosphodiesterase [Leptospiraceae bacterium]MDW7975963.1 cAMP/cGMP-dependent 3',5'-cyclic-AMP/GMP phosphodiesterase [Leptospiraceae bacterium]
MAEIETLKDIQTKIKDAKSGLEKALRIELPRGGYLVQTSVGYIQIGIPPETIKDTMMLPLGTPQIFVIADQMFHVEKGISLAELEFPIYYNHFLRQKKTYIIGTADQCRRLKIALSESLFGPEKLNIEAEYIDGANNKFFPNLKAEIDYFRGNRKFEDLVKFLVFKKENNYTVRLNKVYIKLEQDYFLISDKEWGEDTEVPKKITYSILYDVGTPSEGPYEPPIFGITCLGPSHGFDPEANTSGFIIWLNHKGIMVDPPVNSTEWLRKSNVNPKLIDTIILTHCHADHDAGTFQKILEEGKITIYTTSTILDSFLRKYSALTNIETSKLLELFNFVPVIIGKTYNIHDALFYFKYAFHSIPSLGFGFEFQGKTFYYTSDHLNTYPEVYDKLRDEGILTPGRCEELKKFPWETDIIYHEAGIPPLHTRIDFLNSLPPEIQKKITVYHIAKKDFPMNTHLRYAQQGITNTHVIEISPHKYQETLQILDALTNISIFKNFPLIKAREFLTIVEKVKFERGQKIIEKGSEGNEFFIILSGFVKVEGIDQSPVDDGNKKFEKVYGTYEYFGEAALVLNQKRSADVVAESDVIALKITKDKFLSFIRDSGLEEKFQKLNKTRATGSWEVLMKSNVFKHLTSSQKTLLEFILEEKQSLPGQYLIRRGQVFEHVYIIKKGIVKVIDEDGKEKMKLGIGDFCGEIFNFLQELPSNFDFVSEEACDLYAISRKDMMEYIQDNPGVYMRLYKLYKE